MYFLLSTKYLNYYQQLLTRGSKILLLQENCKCNFWSRDWMKSLTVIDQVQRDRKTEKEVFGIHKPIGNNKN